MFSSEAVNRASTLLTVAATGGSIAVGDMFASGVVPPSPDRAAGF
jgi:hypothetical protein